MAENAIEIQEKPILFSGAMVRAVIEGRKTQTRRVAKLWGDAQATRYEWPNLPMPCLYGKPGDRLWVRETWRPWGFREDDPITVQFPDACVRRTTPKAADLGYEDWYERVAVQATEECISAKCERDSAGNYCWDGFDNCPIKWRPSIHMPRWASRLTLEIVSVKVERVQEISFQDCLAEGVIWTEHWDKVKGADIERYAAKHPKEWTVDESINQSWEDYTRLAFQGLWDSINEKRGFGWKANPWTWAIEFRVLAAGERRA